MRAAPVLPRAQPSPCSLPNCSRVAKYRLRWAVLMLRSSSACSSQITVLACLEWAQRAACAVHAAAFNAGVLTDANAAGPRCARGKGRLVRLSIPA